MRCDMKRWFKYIVVVLAVVALIYSVVRTNYIYADAIKPIEVSAADWYEPNGFRIRVDRYEVFDYEQLESVCIDLDDFITYRKSINAGDAKFLIVYFNLQVTDVDAMDGGWWTDLEMESDASWNNSVDNVIPLAYGDSLSKSSYENGGEYNIVLAFDINKVQVTDRAYENASNWKYRVVWGSNPLYYTNLY